VRRSQSARDDTFPTGCTGFCLFEENNNEFIADVSNGKCHVWMVFDRLRLLGGETCHHHKRAVSLNGKESWVDDRARTARPITYIALKTSKPHPGDSIWESLYEKSVQACAHGSDVTDGKLHIRCEADYPWSTKVAAIIIYPDTIKAEAENGSPKSRRATRRSLKPRGLPGPQAQGAGDSGRRERGGYWLGFRTSRTQ